MFFLLEIAADILHGGKKAVSKVREIPLSDNTTKRRCDDISKDLLKLLVIKLKKSPAYGLQLDETTDISDEQQLAQSMFDKLNEFFEKHDLNWMKCKSGTTDGAAAMQGSTNKAVQKKKSFTGLGFKSLHDTLRGLRSQKIKP